MKISKEFTHLTPFQVFYDHRRGKQSRYKKISAILSRLYIRIIFIDCRGIPFEKVE